MTKLYIRTCGAPPYLFEDEEKVIRNLWEQLILAISEENCIEINKEIIINGNFIVDAYIDNNAGDS